MSRDSRRPVRLIKINLIPLSLSITLRGASGTEKVIGNTCEKSKNR
jgi:hypothetical protein